MSFERLRGQDRARGILERAVRSGRPAHAYLLHGPESVGKELAARTLAASLLCTRREPGDAHACGTCGSCAKLERVVHPDLRVVLPETEAVARGLVAKSDLDGKPSNQIRVAEVRRLVSWLLGSPVDGEQRVALLLDVDRAGTEGQNALLKTLEEPRPGRTLLLVTSAPSGLLPTIRSRCQSVRFGALPEDVLAALATEIGGAEPGVAARAASQARGSATRALELAASGGEPLAEQRAALLALRRTVATDVLDLAETLRGDRTGAAELVDALASLLEERMRPDADDREAGPLAGLATGRAAELVRTARAARRAVLRSANVVLAIEDLLFEVLAAPPRPARPAHPTGPATAGPGAGPRAGARRT